MKTKIVARFFLMVSLFATVIVSCVKDDNLLLHSGSDFETTENQTSSGFIEDVGLINSYVRQMNVLIPDAVAQIQNPALETVLLVGNFRIAFHSVEDGLIPLGDYIFSDAINGDPYTFHSAVLEMSDSIAGAYSSMEIRGGIISVLRNDPEYVFMYNCLCATGDSLKGVFTGEMNYTDNH